MSFFTEADATIKPKRLVFDIETVPLENMSSVAMEHLERKMDRLRRNGPLADEAAEIGKQKSTDPFLSRIACIGILYPETGKEVRLCDSDEKVILQQFWKELDGFEGTFISFNGTRFDCPYINKRSIINGILRPSNKEFLRYDAYNPLPVHFDACTLLGGRDSYVSLELVCDAFGIQSPKDGAVKASGVAQAYAEGRIEEIMDYCIKDLYATYEVYKRLAPYIYFK